MMTSPGTMKHRPPMTAPSRPRKPPRTQDCQLGRSWSGKQVGRGDAVFEFVRTQPATFLDAQLAEQRNVAGRSAKTDDPDAAPLANNGAERHAVFRSMVIGRRENPVAKPRPAQESIALAQGGKASAYRANSRPILNQPRRRIWSARSRATKTYRVFLRRTEMARLGQSRTARFTRAMSCAGMAPS